MTSKVIRLADGSMILEAEDAIMANVAHCIWAMCFIDTDENDNEVVTADKELEVDFIDDVVALFTEAGLCPPLPEEAHA